MRDAYERRLARQLQSSNVDDGAMHAARVGGGASIGIPDATNEKAGDVYRFFCTKAPPFYRGSELRIKDPQNFSPLRSGELLLLPDRAIAVHTVVARNAQRLNYMFLYPSPTGLFVSRLSMVQNLKLAKRRSRSPLHLCHRKPTRHREAHSCFVTVTSAYTNGIWRWNESHHTYCGPVEP